MSQTLMNNKYKYIKNTNWPWIEIDDGSGEDSYLINIQEISAVYTNPRSRYRYGVRFKDGAWLDNFSHDALIELKDLIMHLGKL